MPTFTDAIATDSTLTVAGATTLSGAATLSGAVTVGGALTTQGAVNMSASTVTLPANAVQYGVQTYELTILYTDLAAAASSAEPLVAFPTGVYVLGAGVLINTAFAGEADVAVIIGDTGDDNGLMTVTNLNAVAAGTWLAANGAETGFHYEADYATAGADATFTATALGDLTAGSLTVRVFYIDPNP